jgi:hypothetical protein
MNAAMFYKSFSRLPIQARLGNLAVTINRLADSLEQHQNQEGTKGFAREAMWFIEWTALEVNLEIQTELIDMQRQLAKWARQWNDTWNTLEKSNKMKIETRIMSNKLLEWAGLNKI